MRATIRFVLCAAIAVVALGCSTKNPVASAPLDAASPTSASSSIGAGGGGVSAGTAAGVMVPSGALSSTQNITLSASPSTAPPSQGTLVGTPFVFGPEGLTFSSPITLTLAFDPALLPAGATAKDVQVFTAPVGSSSFTALATTLVDSTHVSASVSHFSVFMPCVVQSDAGAPCGDSGVDATVAATSGGDAGSLSGTWTVTTTAMGGMASAVVTMVTVGQDSLSITSHDFTLTATRTGSVLAFTDHDPPGDLNDGVLSATQDAGAFNAGILPFNLGGSWAIQAGPKGAASSVSCTLSVTAAEIDGACQFVGTNPGPWFTFTSQKMAGASSSLGDFGGQWLNNWTWASTDAGAYPCMLDFSGNGINTCDGGAVQGEPNGSPIAGITFTYDGMNTVSGAAQGWAEFSATR